MGYGDGRGRCAVLLAALLVVAGCTASGSAEPGADGDASSSTASSSVAERSTGPIGTGSGTPAPLVTDPAAEATADLSSPEVAADWMCTSVRAAPEPARVALLERLREEAIATVGEESAVDDALSRACGDLVDALR